MDRFVSVEHVVQEKSLIYRRWKWIWTILLFNDIVERIPYSDKNVTQSTSVRRTRCQTTDIFTMNTWYDWLSYPKTFSVLSSVYNLVTKIVTYLDKRKKISFFFVQKTESKCFSQRTTFWNSVLMLCESKFVAIRDFVCVYNFFFVEVSQCSRWFEKHVRGQIMQFVRPVRPEFVLQTETSRKCLSKICIYG